MRGEFWDRKDLRVSVVGAWFAHKNGYYTKQHAAFLMRQAVETYRAKHPMIGHTTREITIAWQNGFYNVVIPAGAECRKDRFASGTNQWFLTNAGLKACELWASALFRHDATYRYLFVPDDVVAEKPA